MAYCGPRGIPHSVFLGWSSSDQQKAIAWQQHENSRCSSCGTHPQDWVEDRAAWHAESYACTGCVEIARLAQALEGGKARDVRVRLSVGSHGDCPICNPTVSP